MPNSSLTLHPPEDLPPPAMPSLAPISSCCSAVSWPGHLCSVPGWFSSLRLHSCFLPARISLPFTVPNASLRSVFSRPLCTLGRQSLAAAWLPLSSGASSMVLSLCSDPGGVSPRGALWMSGHRRPASSSCRVSSTRSSDRILFKGKSDNSWQEACCQEVPDRCSSIRNGFSVPGETLDARHIAS